MSTSNEAGLKILLPRLSAPEAWDAVKHEFAGENRKQWQYLAIVALHHQANWTLEQIAFTFGYSPGHVSRIVSATKAALKQFLTEGAAALSPVLSEIEDSSCPDASLSTSDL